MMNETKLNPIQINPTTDGEKRASEAFTDLVKGFFEYQEQKFDIRKFIEESCKGATGGKAD